MKIVEYSGKNSILLGLGRLIYKSEKFCKLHNVFGTFVASLFLTDKRLFSAGV
ncbi:MAG: hypothetical protein ACYSWS_00945 [Planctomycetota bacterium]